MDSQTNITAKATGNEWISKVLTGLALLSITFFAAMRSSWNFFAKSGWSGVDSSVFRYIGWEMTMGKVPYRDLFDHKGPLLFFINYIGACIGPDRGIWIVEFVFLFATAFFIYKMARRTLGRGYSLFVVLLVLALLSIYYEYGNLTEEYAMVFQIAATYIFLDFFTFPSKYAEKPAKASLLHWGTKWFNMGVFLCGLCFAGVFLLRVNMISVWIAFCPAVLIYCVREKKYLALWKFILSFLLGAAALMLPTLIYLVKNHAFGDFIYTYFVFNMQYSSNTFSKRVQTFVYFLDTLPLLLSLFVMGAKITREWGKKEFSAIRLFDCTYVIYILLTLILVAMSGRKYSHYGMVLCPTFSYPFCTMCRALVQKEVQKAKVNLVVIAYLTITFLVPNWLPAVSGAVQGVYDGLQPTDVDQPKDEIVSYIIEHTEPDDEISVFGNDDSYYLYARRRSASKYSYQFPIAKVAPAILDEYFEELLAHQPKIIVVKTTNTYVQMEDFLEENDYARMIEGDVLLYQKREVF